MPMLIARLANVTDSVKDRESCQKKDIQTTRTRSAGNAAKQSEKTEKVQDMLLNSAEQAHMLAVYEHREDENRTGWGSVG